MKQWLFMGGCDKRDLLLYTCKMMALDGSKVLLVDWTDGHMYRYLIKTGIEELAVTEYNGFDITWSTENAELAEYNYCLYDIGTATESINVQLEGEDRLVWISTPDRCELGRSIDWLRKICKQHPQFHGREIQPVFIRALDAIGSHAYTLDLLTELPLVWKEKMISIPWNEGNEEIRLSNEHTGMIRMKRITRAYKQALIELVRELTGWTRTEVRGVFRQAERRGA